MARAVRLLSNIQVSIHALTRSATSVFICAMQSRMFQSTHSRGVRLTGTNTATEQASFNPRTHEECDKAVAHTLSNFLAFQSTHSRGVRPVRI